VFEFLAATVLGGALHISGVEMPCYLFTFHGHGTWLPDHPKGYVKRGQGVQRPDTEMAERYRERMDEPKRIFNQSQARFLMSALRSLREYQDLRIHACAIESTHVHVLVSWKDRRKPDRIGAALKQALSRRLNLQFGKQTWWSRGSSRKRVSEQEHFDHLIKNYLPGHTWHWNG